MHIQRNLLLPGAVLVAARGYGPELRKGDFLPLTILNMQVLTTLLVAQAGGCSRHHGRLRRGRGSPRWIREERVNGVERAAGAHALDGRRRAMLREDLASLDEVWTGGGDCPEPVRAAFAGEVRAAGVATYGLSEAPTVVSIDDRDGRSCGRRERKAVAAPRC